MRENTSLTPYRAAPSALELIPEDSVPDCGREETRAIERRLSGIWDLCYAAKKWRSKRRWLATWLTTSCFVSWGAVCLSGGLAQVMTSLALTALGFGFFYWYESATGELFDDHSVLSTRELDTERASLRGRLDSLMSLERLTGKGANAKKLSDEVAAFNKDLRYLSETDCGAGDRMAIISKRREIMGRINAFRQQTLPESQIPEPPLLAAVND